MAHKTQNDGLEAPWNSLDFPVEISQSYHTIPKNIKAKSYSKLNFSDSKIPTKKLIDKGMSNRTNAKRSTPNAVTHLVSMDSSPSKMNLMVHEKKCKDDNSRKHLPQSPQDSFSHYRSHNPTIFRKTKEELLLYGNKKDSGQLTKCLYLAKSLRREHPQEEQLQKFKKDFEAWQASKLWEHSKTHEQKDSHRRGNDNQVLAQEYLNKEKMVRYKDTRRNSADKNSNESKDYVSAYIHNKRNYADRKFNESKDYVSTAKSTINKQPGLGHEGRMNRECQCSLKDGTTLRNRAKTNKFEHLSVARLDKKQDRSCYPTKIVVLKPNSEGNDIEESQVGSTDMEEKEGMEDFLKEVKERLRFEMQIKAQKASAIRGSGIQTSISEQLNDPKQLAQDIAKHIRESVRRDLRMMSKQSKSTKSCSSLVRLNGSDSPECINRNRRKLLSEKLENDLRVETDVVNPLINYGTSGSSLLTKEKARLKSTSDFSKMGENVNCWELKKALSESRPRHKQVKNVTLDVEAVSPRNLIRSSSASLSGTASGKLVLEDKHVLTRAQIRRNLKVSGHTTTLESKHKKVSLNLEGRVSNLPQNFTIKDKLFGRKIQSVEESAADIFDSMKAIPTTVADVLDFGTLQGNYLEVPPSPTSVSTSSQEEFCRPVHPSPVFSLEVPFIEDHPSPLVSGELSTSIPELRLSEQVDIDVSEPVEIEEKASEDEMVEVEGLIEAYLGDILIASGLHDEVSSDQAVSRWDALTNPIPQCVFEKVEEAYITFEKADNETSRRHHGDTNTGHKLLFDLMNEALPTVLGTPFSFSKSKSWVAHQSAVPHGKKLLNDLWHQIQIYTFPTKDESYSMDRVLARDVEMTPWPSMLHVDIHLEGMEIERVLLDELIDEFLYDERN